MQRPNFLPAKTFGCGHVLSNICGSTTRQMPFVSLSSNFRPMFSWEPIWRLTKSDTTAVEFVACMTVQNILSLASRGLNTDHLTVRSPRTLFDFFASDNTDYRSLSCPPWVRYLDLNGHATDIGEVRS